MKINSIYKKFTICTVLIMGISIAGCNKFVDVPAPVDSITGVQTFDTDAKADAAVRGMYLYMVLSATSGYGATSAGLGVCSDELSLATNTSANIYYQLYNNAITSANGAIYNYYWGPMYNVIYTANAIIEGCANSTGMSDAAKVQYTAEAKFLRAVNYFYLVNLWGDVPMPVSSDYTVNATLSRAPSSQVYSLIVSDLQYAQANLAKTYLGGALRYRANRYAASAMLARVYLYQQDWADAETAASDVIDGSASGTYILEPTLNNVFLVTSKEVILQIVQPATNLYTWDGTNFAASATSPLYPITDALYTSFETGDLRKTNWIKVYSTTVRAPYKYKITSGTTATTARTEALVFLRLSEQYLIRAEARAQQSGKLASAITDLDAVRKRAIPSPFFIATSPTISQVNLLTTIAHERFVELFAEQGHRWLDLKRTGQADVVLANKPNWTPQAKLFPIPATDITNDHNLVQNPGYN